MLASCNDPLPSLASTDEVYMNLIDSWYVSSALVILLMGLLCHHFVCQPLQELKAAVEESDCTDAFNWHTVVCPKRRQRFLKCARRCRRNRAQQEDHERDTDASSAEQQPCEQPAEDACWVMQHCSSSFAKLHLPPPLPFVRRRRRRRGKCCHNKAAVSASMDVGSKSNDVTSEPAAIQKLMPLLKKEELTADTKSVALSLSHSNVSNEASSSSSTSGMKASLTPNSTATSPLPRSALLDLVRMQQWKTILNHPQRDELFRRRNAKFCDADGLYPLHWACSGAPPTTLVQALLEAYPSAARKVDHEGSNALHFACHYSASPAVVEALLSVYPQAAQKQDKYGRTPIYHAVDKSANLAVLRALVQAAPQASITLCLPKVVRREYNGKITRAMAVRTPLFLAWAAALSTEGAKTKWSGKKRAKAELLLQHAGGASREDLSILCHAISFDVYLPDSVLPLLLHEDSTGDGQGPLSVAAVTHFHSPERSQDVWKWLLGRYAVPHNVMGKQSPLALAASAGQRWQDVLQPILAAAPEAVGVRDPITGLFPAFLAATTQSTDVNTAKDSRSKNDDKVDTTNRLLKWLEQSDPYQLLTRKNRDALRMRLMGQPVVESTLQRQRDDLQQDHTTAQLEAVFHLLQADPAILSSR